MHATAAYDELSPPPGPRAAPPRAHLQSHRQLGPGGDRCRPRATRRAPRRWPRWTRCCIGCAPIRALAELTRRAPSRSRWTSRSAPTCARCGASGASRTRCPSRWCSARSLADVALRARLAQRSARPTTGPGFCANLREVVRLAREEAKRCRRRHRPVALRRADGPLRAGHDQRRGRSPSSATCGSGCRADPHSVRERQARETVRRAGRPVPGGGAARAVRTT